MTVVFGTIQMETQLKLNFSVSGEHLQRVEMKNGAHCTAHQQKGQGSMDSFGSTTRKHHYLKSLLCNQQIKSMFQKRVPFFMSEANQHIGNIAINEYVGEQPFRSAPH